MAVSGLLFSSSGSNVFRDIYSFVSYSEPSGYIRPSHYTLFFAVFSNLCVTTFTAIHRFKPFINANSNTALIIKPLRPDSQNRGYIASNQWWVHFLYSVTRRTHYWSILRLVFFKRFCIQVFGYASSFAPFSNSHFLLCTLVKLNLYTFSGCSSINYHDNCIHINQNWFGYLLGAVSSHSLPFWKKWSVKKHFIGIII